jgi:hypothetical protein
MYSKNQGIPYGVRRPGAERFPSYRQPDRPRMQVPPNYSGHAIVDGEERPLGSPPEAVTDLPAADLPGGDPPTPRFDDLPRVSDLGSIHHRPPPVTVPASFEETEPPPPAVAPAETPAPPRKPALFDLAHFPFGHGIGFEELLILGLILFFLHENADCEDRGDLDETVILLGLLLLLG